MKRSKEEQELVTRLLDISKACMTAINMIDLKEATGVRMMLDRIGLDKEVAEDLAASL